MFDDIPDNYRPQTASDPEEGWRYTQGDKNARRPPELLTRDHVARCISREVKAGRGSPHGGVFLDIAWIKEKLPNAAEHIKRKLPSMYHQFKELADLDITQEPMEVGPDDALHHGRHSRGRRHAGVDGSGPVRRRRMRGGHQRREPARRQLAVGPHRRSASAPANTPRRTRRRGGRRAERRGQVDARPRGGARAVRPRRAGENPFKVQHDLQETHAGPGRHRARRGGDAGGARRGSSSSTRGRPRRRGRPSRVPHRLARVRSICAICSRCRRPSRDRRSNGARAAAGTSATTSRTSRAEFATFNIAVQREQDRRDGGRARGRSPRCPRN